MNYAPTRKVFNPFEDESIEFNEKLEMKTKSARKYTHWKIEETEAIMAWEIRARQ